MNQQPDKFFREKLEHYQKPAPSTAWDKIADAQRKKNGRGLWLKIAASLLLLAIAGYFLWPTTVSVEQQRSISSNVQSTDPKGDSTAQPGTTTEIKKPESNAESKNNFQAKKEAKTKEIVSRRNAVVKKNIEEKKSTLALVNERSSVPVINDKNIMAEALIIDSVETPIAEVQSNKEKEVQSITLIYTAKEVDEYLDKNALAEATSRDKKPSTLKKLLQKANDLKNNQDPFGELRQKKNEILALNFKNEKRGQNK